MIKPFVLTAASVTRSNGRGAGRVAVAVTAAALVGIVLPSASAAITSTEAVSHLNAQRLANGIPGVTESPTLSEGCRNHNAYMKLNNGMIHGENPGNPGYTESGAGKAPGSGGSEVLSGGGEAWDDAWKNPWSTAPIHLLLMFQPSVTLAGQDDNGDYECMRMSSVYGQPKPAAPVYSLPGNGAANVPSSYYAAEYPYTPGELVGAEGETGYNVLLWRPGSKVNVSSATLTGPAGAVDVRVVDNRTPTPRVELQGFVWEGGTWYWPGAVVIPVKPLQSEVNYSLTVVFDDSVTYHSSFRTAAAPKKQDPEVDPGEDPEVTEPGTYPQAQIATSQVRRGRHILVRFRNVTGVVQATVKRGSRPAKTISLRVRSNRALISTSALRPGVYRFAIRYQGHKLTTRTVAVRSR